MELQFVDPQKILEKFLVKIRSKNKDAKIFVILLSLLRYD